MDHGELDVPYLSVQVTISKIGTRKKTGSDQNKTLNIHGYSETYPETLDPRRTGETRQGVGSRHAIQTGYSGNSNQPGQTGQTLGTGRSIHTGGTVHTIWTVSTVGANLAAIARYTRRALRSVVAGVTRLTRGAATTGVTCSRKIFKVALN